MPIGVSRISAVPQARPAAGQRLAVAGGTSQRSSLATSACHCSLPRSLSTMLSLIRLCVSAWSMPERSTSERATLRPGPTGTLPRAGSMASPPVRSESVGVRSSADEMSTCPVAGFHWPAALTTARGSRICRPSHITVSFSTSPPARVICQLPPCAASVADAFAKPPSSTPASTIEGARPSHRGCQRASSPVREQSAAIDCDPGAARSHGPCRRPSAERTDPRFTSAPPVSVTSSVSSAAVTIPWH